MEVTIMKIEFIEDREKLIEIKNSLPSKTIMWSPDVILIKHPNRDVHYVLKSRVYDSDLPKLPQEKFIHFNERRNWDADNSDLERKLLIFDHEMLNKRGQDILMSL
jgi:hypothetical protein